MTRGFAGEGGDGGQVKCDGTGYDAQKKKT